MLIAASEQLRARYRDLSNTKLIAVPATSRPPKKPVTAAEATAYSLRLLARCWLASALMSCIRSAHDFQGSETKAWARFEPRMTPIADLDTGQVLGVVDGGGTTSVSGTGCSPGIWSGSWPSKSLRSTPPRRSGRRFHPGVFRDECFHVHCTHSPAAGSEATSHKEQWSDPSLRARKPC